MPGESPGEYVLLARFGVLPGEFCRFGRRDLGFCPASFAVLGVVPEITDLRLCVGGGDSVFSLRGWWRKCCRGNEGSSEGRGLGGMREGLGGGDGVGKSGGGGSQGLSGVLDWVGLLRECSIV